MPKLGQLLIERSSVKKRKMSLVEQLKAVVWAPEDQKDEYMASGAKLMQNFFDLSKEEVDLTRRISEINSTVVVHGTNLTLAQAIAQLSNIHDTLSLYDALLDRIQGLPIGEEKSETSWVNILSVENLSNMKDNKIQELEELDAAIQNTNWNTEIELQNSSQSKAIVQNQPEQQPVQPRQGTIPQQHMSNKLTPEQAKLVEVYQQLDKSGDKGYHEPHTNPIRPQDIMPEASYEEPHMQKKAETLDLITERFLRMPKIKDPACPVCNLDDVLRAKVDAVYHQSGEIMKVHQLLEESGKNITGPQLRRYLDEFHPTRGTPNDQTGPYVPQV